MTGMWKPSPIIPVILFVASISISAPGPAMAIDGSAVQKDPNGHWYLVMPSELSTALRDSVPQFVIATDSSYADSLRRHYPYGEHAAPFALITDFNQDTREDVVIDGSENGDRVVYLALSEGHSYRFIPVLRRTGRIESDVALFWDRSERSHFGLSSSDLVDGFSTWLPASPGSPERGIPPRPAGLVYGMSIRCGFGK